MGDLLPFFLDENELVARARQHADEYRSAKPFPHVVLDDFLPAEIAAACADEFPGTESIAWDLYTDNGRTFKLTTSSESLMPPIARQCVSQFNSGAMIRFLQELTGITGLVADPSLGGGGLHRIEPGGFLDVHADYNHHWGLNLDRRLNVLFYLNPDWEERWGGQLELWDRSMSRCERRIVPILNRCVIFNTTDTSFHGHPDRLACPPGHARKSLAFYYYTNGRPAEEQSDPHSTLYQSPGQRPRRPSAPIRTVVNRRLPPKLKEAARATAQRVRSVRQPSPNSSSEATSGSSSGENHWTMVNRVFAEALRQGKAIRPNYTWSLLHVAGVARTLGLEGFTAIEFGVAGGNGLVALEDAADLVKQQVGVTVDVVGFDHGIGLPSPRDYLDAPYLMQAGQFSMDEQKLRGRLRYASLRIGLVENTLSEFIMSGPKPIGFISFDLDYYSSTMDAFALFDAEPQMFFPRVLCYFDDVLGYPWGDSNGERKAILDFNKSHSNRVIDHLPGLRYQVPPPEFDARWVDCMYLAHILDHPRGSEDEGVALVTRLDLT